MKKKNNKGIKTTWLLLGKFLFCILVILALALANVFNKVEDIIEDVPEEIVAKTIPKVYFEGDITNMETKTDVRQIKLIYESDDIYFEAYTEIKIQGTSSLAYEKKNYTINLYEDEEYENKKNVDIGYGFASKYCLKANWIDKTHARNIVTARIASSIQEKYGLFLDTPNNGVVDGFPVEVYSNGEFLGLYTWNIPKDAWMFHMDEENENHIVLSGNGWTEGNMFTSLTDFSEWEVEVGTENDETLKKFNRLVGFVKNSTNEIFKNEFSNYLNLDSAINYFIMLEFAQLVDNSGKNMLMITYDGNVWYPSLYDLDTAFGTNPYGSALLDYTVVGNSLASNLWKRLVEVFPNEIKERYRELRENILTEENIMKEFKIFSNSIPNEIFQKELEKWGPILPGYDLTQIEEFLRVRIPIVDAYMYGL